MKISQSIVLVAAIGIACCAAINLAFPLREAADPTGSSCDDRNWDAVTLSKITWSESVPDAYTDYTFYGALCAQCVQPQIEKIEVKVRALRAWATRLPPGCERTAYLNWADYFDEHIKDFKDAHADKSVPPQ